MLKLYRILPARDAPPLQWMGQFPDEHHALAEYNAEVRREHSEGIRTRHELAFIEGLEREAEYWLVEQEITHTRVRRDEAFESARWGLARREGSQRR